MLRESATAGAAGLSGCRVACHGTHRSLMTIRSSPCHVVGDERASLPHGPRLARGVLGLTEVFLLFVLGSHCNLPLTADAVIDTVVP
jgi:hypothetical protein